MACYHFTIKTDRMKDGTRVDASEHTAYIERTGKFKDVDEKNRPYSAPDHADYINRDAAFSYRGGCIGKGNRLPSWANGSAREFFTAANRYESSKNCRYREIEFALPNELNRAQQQEIIDRFLDRHLKDFYYAYAIHDKIGMMSNGERNTHVHIMFSERRIDDVEKTKERSPEEFFSRHTKVNGVARGGAAKDPKWNGKDRAKYLCKMRRDFAMLQNEALEKAGFSVRVDHRTLKEQRASALARGDFKLAKLLDRVPERHLGPEITAQENHPAVVQLKKYRAVKEEYRKLLYAADLLESNLEKQKNLVASDENLRTAKKVLKKADLSLQTDSSLQVKQLKENVLTTLREIYALKAVAVWQDEAARMAQERFMSEEELSLCGQLKMLRRAKEEAQALLKSLPKPKEWLPQDGQIYEELTKELNRRLSVYREQTTELTDKMKPVYERLEKQEKAHIKNEMIAILAENKPNKLLLKQRTRQLSALLEDLQAEILLHAEKLPEMKRENSAFTSKEVAGILRYTEQSVKMEMRRLKNAMTKLAPKVVSLNRANAMAKNLFVNGGFKALSEKEKQIKKECGRIAHARMEYEEAQKAFDRLPKPKWYQGKSVYRKRKRGVDEMKAALEKREALYSDAVFQIEREREQLEARCLSAEAQKKISAISLGILEKNRPIAARHEALLKKYKTLLAKSKKLGELQKATGKQIGRDKNAVRYSISKSRSNTAIGSLSKSGKAYAIAKAFAGDARMARIVAYTKQDDAERKFEESAKSKTDREVERITRAE